MEALLAKIKKSGGSELWVALREFQGRQYVDVREHFLTSDSRDWHPTKKGVMLDPADLPAVIDGIEEIDGNAHATSKTIPKGEKVELRIGYREFERHHYCEVRTWYLDNKLKEMRPSPKGFTFGLELRDSLLEALREAEDQLP